MEELESKNYKQYDYVSRYEGFPYYYHKEDNKYIYGITGQISKDITFVTHTVRPYDTLDSLALTYYGRPDYYWIIADYNDILDPLLPLYTKFKNIKIPTFTAVKYKG